MTGGNSRPPRPGPYNRGIVSGIKESNLFDRCSECGGRIVVESTMELYCSNCGLVPENKERSR